MSAKANELLIQVQIGGKVMRVDLNHYTAAPDSYSLTEDRALVVGHEDRNYVLDTFMERFNAALRELRVAGIKAASEREAGE